MKNKGYLISVEGVEGCGKDTQIKYLIEYLENQGLKVAYYNPVDTLLGKYIRDIILVDSDMKIIDKSIFLLFLADRIQYIDTFIKPKLDEGYVVICNRFTDSTIVYQSLAGGLSIDIVGTTINLFTDIIPDLTLLLDIDPKIGLARKYRQNQGKLDLIERKGFNFHNKVRDGFLLLAKNNSKRIKVINANRNIEFVFSSIIKLVNYGINFHYGLRLDDKEGLIPSLVDSKDNPKNNVVVPENVKFIVKD